MERLSEGLRAALTPALMEELQRLLDVKAEESQLTESSLKMALEKVLQDSADLEQSRKADNEEWEREKERLEANVEATRRNEQEKVRLDLRMLGHEIKMMTEQAESERDKVLALEKECQRIRTLLEKEMDLDQMMVKDPERIKAESANWTRWTQERVNATLSTVLTTVSAKQKWLNSLKNRPEKCMAVSEEVAQVARNTTSKPCLDDELQSQSCCSSQKVEQLIIQKQKLQGKIDNKFQKKMAHVMAEAAKQEEKIRAAELKKKKQLEDRSSKELEKLQKAELKDKERREEKERKAAKKLERKREKEERALTRQSRFFFWRRSSRAN